MSKLLKNKYPDLKGIYFYGSKFNAENRIHHDIFFYSASALAYKNNFSTSKLKQLRNWFYDNFVKNEILSHDIWKIYSKIFDNRLTGIYDDFKKFDIDQMKTDFDEMKFFYREVKRFL